MLCKAVLWKLPIQRGHFRIARDFRQNRRGADFRHPAIAFDNRQRRYGQRRTAVTINKNKFRGDAQTRDGALHGQHGRV